MSSKCPEPVNVTSLGNRAFVVVKDLEIMDYSGEL